MFLFADRRERTLHINNHALPSLFLQQNGKDSQSTQSHPRRDLNNNSLKSSNSARLLTGQISRTDILLDMSKPLQEGIHNRRITLLLLRGRSGRTGFGPFGRGDKTTIALTLSLIELVDGDAADGRVFLKAGAGGDLGDTGF